MITFINYLKADFYKLWHSEIILTHVIIPIVGIITMLSYYTISSWSESEKILAYIQVISMIFPLIIALIVTMVYDQEERTKGFQYFLSVPNKLYIPHLAKLILLIILGIISTIIAILGFGIIFKLMGNNSLKLSFYLQETCIMFISNIPIYMIQYLVVFCFGKGASIGLGIIGSLISALMITGIGDIIWLRIPWGYSIRLTSYFFQYKITNNLSLALEAQINSPMISMLVFIIIGIIFLLIFSNYWEGKKENN